MSSYPLEIHTQHFDLLPQKCIHWRNKNTLLISDLHLGKAGHFRKNGLFLPQESGMADLILLEKLLLEFKPTRLLILGDLFHSVYNPDWEHFGELRKRFAHIVFDLVPGNHDILHKQHYTRFDITFLPTIVKEEHFVFSHIPMEVEGPFLNVSGHVHPGFYLEGKARNSVRLPCFYLHDKNLILPAFGQLTGLSLVQKKENTGIYVSTGKSVLKI